MRDDWHREMQEKFKYLGERLGFKAETEVKIPKGKIDCVWESKEPISEYFVAFEFESATTGSQIVENLVKSLSMPLQMRPRFLVQAYKGRLEDINREYVENISSTLPITIKIVDNVGNNVEKASLKIITELFNWIGEYAGITMEFLGRLEEILGKENIIRVFHYGEPSMSHLKYLDNALRHSCSKNYLLWIKSIPTEKNENIILNEFKSLSKYDILILSDIPLKYCNITLLKNFLEKEVRQEGKSMILTGGYGLTSEYNKLGEENLGGKIGGRFEKKGTTVKIEKNEYDIGRDLAFKGFNRFKPIDQDEVIARWDKDDFPALVVHRVGRGKIIIFTSDCSPSWGTPSIESTEFQEMWKQIMDKFILLKNNLD